MTFSLSFFGLLALVALFVGLTIMLVGILLGWRDSLRQNISLRDDLLAAVTPQFSAQSVQMENILSRHITAWQERDDALRRDLSAIQADLEWLSGERMIEQALSMFHDGKSDRDVSQELGLPLETVQTLHMLRAH